MKSHPILIRMLTKLTIDKKIHIQYPNEKINSFVHDWLVQHGATEDEAYTIVWEFRVIWRNCGSYEQIIKLK